MTVSLGGIPPVLVLGVIGGLVVLLPLIVIASGRAAIDALHARGGRISRLLTSVSDWAYFSTPAVPEEEARRRRPGVHKVRRRIVLDSIIVTIRRTCDAYRAVGLDSVDHPIPAKEFATMAGKRTYTGNLLRTLQAELRELSTYETGTAALKLPIQPTYDELVELRTTLTKLHGQPD